MHPDGAEPRLELFPESPKLRKPRQSVCSSALTPPPSPAIPPPRRHSAPGGAFGLRERYLPQASGLGAQGILSPRARSPGAHCPRPAQRRRLREGRLMLQGKPKAREPQRRRDLARVNRLSPEQSVRATSQPRAPPSLPRALARSPPPSAPCAPPGRCEGRFPGTFQESVSRDRSPRQRFKEARALMRRLQGSRPESRCGCRWLRVAVWDSALL